MASVGRFAASVLIVAGALCLLDATVTFLWQEPISALLGERGQSRLDAALDETAPSVSEQGLSPRDAKRLADNYATGLEPGSAFGRIRLPNVKRRYAIGEGADSGTLRSGPGHYTGTDLPGQGGTVGIAGHRTTYLAPFRHIDQLGQGETIVVEMPYGTFRYTVERREIVAPTDAAVLDPAGGREQLVLTACHPLYSAAKRLVVFASLERREESSRDSVNNTRATTIDSATTKIAVQ